MFINKNQQPSCVGCPIPTILKYLLNSKVKWEEHIHLFFFLQLLDSWVDMDHNIILVCLKYTQNLFVSDTDLLYFSPLRFRPPPCLYTHTHSVIFKKHNQNRTWKLRTQYLSVETVHTKAACSYIFPNFHFFQHCPWDWQSLGARLEAPFTKLWLHYRLSRGHIWNPFPAGVHRECLAVVNTERCVSCLAVSCLSWPEPRTWLLVKVFMCLCDHRYVPSVTEPLLHSRSPGAKWDGDEARWRECPSRLDVTIRRGRMVVGVE